MEHRRDDGEYPTVIICTYVAIWVGSCTHQEEKAQGMTSGVLLFADIMQYKLQWNLSKTITCGPALTDLYREVAALQRVDCNVLLLFGAREAGCFKEMAI